MGYRWGKDSKINTLSCFLFFEKSLSLVNLVRRTKIQRYDLCKKRIFIKIHPITSINQNDITCLFFSSLDIVLASTNLSLLIIGYCVFYHEQIILSHIKAIQTDNTKFLYNDLSSLIVPFLIIYFYESYLMLKLLAYKII